MPAGATATASAVATPESVPPADPFLASLARAAPAAVGRSDTIRDAGGVYIGRPKGWRDDEGMCPGPSWLGGNPDGRASSECACEILRDTKILTRPRDANRVCAVWRPTKPKRVGRVEGTLNKYSLILGRGEASSGESGSL